VSIDINVNLNISFPKVEERLDHLQALIETLIADPQKIEEMRKQLAAKREALSQAINEGAKP
jgi:uncharacterized protein (DUF342 family)